MAVRARAMVPSTASRIFIRVEGYRPDRLAGVIYNPYLDKSARFNDVIEFANRLDGMFDEMSFPLASVAYRSFTLKGKRKKPAQGRQKVEEEGNMAKEPLSQQDSDVFVVHVQFRQNATWQGTITWAGQNEERRFRSTLELLKIMDSVLGERHPEDTGE